MRVLVACEESQEVCKAFRALGHEAYSCDIEPCSGGHPEWHIQCDAWRFRLVHICRTPEQNTCSRGAFSIRSAIGQGLRQKHFS